MTSSTRYILHCSLSERPKVGIKQQKRGCTRKRMISGLLRTRSSIVVARLLKTRDHRGGDSTVRVNLEFSPVFILYTLIWQLLRLSPWYPQNILRSVLFKLPILSPHSALTRLLDAPPFTDPLTVRINLFSYRKVIGCRL